MPHHQDLKKELTEIRIMVGKGKAWFMSENILTIPGTTYVKSTSKTPNPIKDIKTG